MDKRAKIENRLLDVVDMQSYISNMHKPHMTAIEIEKDEKRYILPFRSNHDDRPGVYSYGCIYLMKFPKDCVDANEEEFLYDSVPVFDFNSCDDMKTLLNTQSQIRDIESSILTDIENEYHPRRHDDDTPAITLLKNAIDAKRFDIRKYEDRYGINYLNDIRLLNGKDITLKKLLHHADRLDMEVEMIIRDKNPDVPNPMGIEVRKILNSSTPTELSESEG